MRTQYDEELKRVHHALVEMGTMIENAISGAIDALEQRDEKRAREIIAYDEKINRQEKEIEEMCIRLLLLQQPVAGDLRKISTTLKLITDMERIGDHAADISEIVLTLPEGKMIGGEHFREMAHQTSDMLLKSVGAYVGMNEKLARSVIAQDDVVDRLFDMVKKDVIDSIVSDPKDGEAATDVLLIAKYFERIGDHATNIAEWAIFAMTGKHVES